MVFEFLTHYFLSVLPGKSQWDQHYFSVDVSNRAKRNEKTVDTGSSFYLLTSLMKRALLRSAALIRLGSLSLVCVIFLPPIQPSHLPINPPTFPPTLPPALQPSRLPTTLSQLFATWSHLVTTGHTWSQIVTWSLLVTLV